MEGYVDNSGVGIYYTTLGPRRSDRAPTVALHGGPGASHGIFLPGVAPLAEHRQVVLYDQRGCGNSTMSGEDIASCTLADNVTDLEALRRNLDLGTIDLMGHSWGGLLAMAYAVEMEQNVRRLVLVSPALPHYPNSTWTEFLVGLAPEKRAEIVRIRQDGRRSEIAKQAAIWRTAVRELFHRKEALETIELERIPYSPQIAARIAEDLDGLDLRPRLARLRLPTLIVAGRFDIRLPVKHHESLASLLPEATLRVMESSGHFPFLEERDSFVEVVEEFLA